MKMDEDDSYVGPRTREAARGRVMGKTVQEGRDDCADVNDPSPISLSQRVKELEDAALTLHEALNSLAERIDPLLLPERDGDGSKEGPRPTPHQSPVAEHLESLVARFGIAVNRVDNLRNRLAI